MPNGVRPTLISGFEDIIEYIQQQDQRIMALSQHNKELNNILGDFAECQDKLKTVEAENTTFKRTILSLKSSVIDLREARDKYVHKLNVIKNEVEFVQLELDGRVWTMDDEFVLTPLKGSDSEDETDDSDEEEKCAE